MHQQLGSYMTWLHCNHPYVVSGVRNLWRVSIVLKDLLPTFLGIEQSKILNGGDALIDEVFPHSICQTHMNSVSE